MSLGALLLERLARDPERVCLDGDGGRHTRGEIRARALSLAGGLQQAGVVPGDRVVMSLAKGPWLAAAHVGVLAAGAVAAPVNEAFPDDSLARLIERSEPSLVLGEPDFTARTRRLAPAVPAWSVGEELGTDAGPAGTPVPRAPDDLALLAFTSGTTGTPKGVPLSHRNVDANLEVLARVWQWTEADRLLHVLPVFHLHGLALGLYGSLRAGNAIVFHQRFDAARVLAELPGSGVRMLMAVPTMLHRLLEAAPAEGNPLADLRLVVSGSGPLSPMLFERFRARFGHAPVERYGLSETLMDTSNPAAGARKPGSVGPPLPGVEVRLREPDGRTDAGDGPGEVWVRGPNVFGGYWRDANATAAAFDGDWFRSGDLGRFDDDGYLFLTGRAKELIVSGGYNVSPVAVEQSLEPAAHEGVRELAVGGVSDDDLGERVVAFVVPGEGDWDATEARLRAAADAALPRYARPREYRRVACLPRNALGKLQRHLLTRAQD